jgi:hypothetical protein
MVVTSSICGESCPPVRALRTQQKQARELGNCGGLRTVRYDVLPPGIVAEIGDGDGDGAKRRRVRETVAGRATVYVNRQSGGRVAMVSRPYGGSPISGGGAAIELRLA